MNTISRRIARLVVIALLALASCNAAGAITEEQFQKANSEFASGDFKAAITDYNAVIAAGEWSANLFYNLGNAYYRVGDFGRAILNYERALRLDHTHPEAEANLQLARDETRALELRRSAAERYFGNVSISVFVIAAAAFFWLAVVLLILRSRGRSLAPAITCLILFVASAVSVYLLENGTRGKASAVILGANIDARVATADTARSILALPPGSEVLILRERGDWTYAALPSDQRGWIPANAVEKVRL